MSTVAVGYRKAWTAPAHGPGMTCWRAGPGETTLPLHHATQGEGPGAQMMKKAGEEEDGGEEVEAGLTTPPVTSSTSLDRNQELGEVTATL